MKPALFLDRDGTVMEDHGYIRDPDLVQLLPGASETLREIAAGGRPLIVVSNQSGVGRGVMTLDEMHAVHARFLEALRAGGVEIAASYLCVHHPDEHCPCRKPSTFHLEQAARELGLDLSKSWMMGDRRSDIVCGRDAGCKTIWLSNPHFPPEAGVADFVAQDWREARRILTENAPNA